MNNSQKNITITQFFYSIIKPYRWWYILLLQAPVIGALYVPVNNYAIKLLIDKISSNQQLSFELLTVPITLYCLASIILETVWRIANYADLKSQPKIEAEIINKSYEILLNYKFNFFQDNLSGKTASKINGIRDGYIKIFDLLRGNIIWQVVGIFTAIFMLFFVHKIIAIGVVILLVIFMPFIFLSKRKSFSHSKNATNVKQKITGLLNDSISNIASVLLFSNKSFEKKLLKNANQDFIATENIRLKFMFINHAIIGLMYVVLSIVVLFLLINLKIANLISTGDLIMSMGLMYFIIDITWQFSNALTDLISEIGNLKESFAIINQDNFAEDYNITQKLIIKNPIIEFKNIAFAHQNSSRIFADFNLTIKAGQKIGIVGLSGAGKSTLINLLLKKFKIDDGEILIDHKNIYQHSTDSLRYQIALIPQDTMLFHRSIAENIGYAREDASQEEIIEASKKAHIHDFIISLANGYQTLVGERGIKLSGGQRQRIAIARAILKDAKILILDEATASLDSHTEHHIQESLNLLIDETNSKSKKTIIAIAHRLSTLKHMDRIIVLDHGKIVEDGTHKQLLKTKGYYHKMWNMQAGGFLPEEIEDESH
jgi:ATP-binding cassette subfamily B protein